MTQPAVSYALARLRSVMANPIFVRSRDGMIPTTLADNLYEDFRRGLEIIDATLKSVAEFEPSRSDRRFRIAMTDIGEMVFLPPLVRFLRQAAPKIRVEGCQVSLVETPRALATGQLDFAIGNLPSLHSRVGGVDLFTERYVCLFREDHPTIGETLSVDEFKSCQHVLVSSLFNSHNEIYDVLLAKGLVRRIALQLSHFTSLPSILSESDLVAAVPSRVAQLFATTHRLRSLPIPVPLPTFDVRVHWDPRFNGDRGHSWVRQAIIAVLSEL
jgi:DNA-binding transcriptional LysR family regulator